MYILAQCASVCRGGDAGGEWYRLHIHTYRVPVFSLDYWAANQLHVLYTVYACTHTLCQAFTVPTLYWYFDARIRKVCVCVCVCVCVWVGE